MHHNANRLHSASAAGCWRIRVRRWSRQWRPHEAPCHRVWHLNHHRRRPGLWSFRAMNARRSLKGCPNVAGAAPQRYPRLEHPCRPDPERVAERVGLPTRIFSTSGVDYRCTRISSSCERRISPRSPVKQSGQTEETHHKKVMKAEKGGLFSEHVDVVA